MTKLKLKLNLILASCALLFCIQGAGAHKYEKTHLGGSCSHHQECKSDHCCHLIDDKENIMGGRCVDEHTYKHSKLCLQEN